MGFDPGKVEKIPRMPGVYLMKDEHGRVLYVGKAKDLRSRVRSYFGQRGDGRHKIRFLLNRLEDLEVVVTKSEKEALILENTFIKRYRPRYNVAYRDDKNYFHIRVDQREPFPRASLVRRPQRDGATYFGPYDSSQSVRQTLRLLQRHMGLRACKESQVHRKKRTCLNFQMGRCAGVCRGGVTPDQYAERVKEAMLFLQGRSKQLIDRLTRRMKAAAEALRFEEAARIRNQIRAIERTLEGQRVVTPLGTDRDVFGLFRTGDRGFIVILQIREGKVSKSVSFPLNPTPLGDVEVIASFLKQFYDSAKRSIPAEILLPAGLEEETAVLEQWLGELGGHRVKIRRPQRGESKRLIELAQQNAELARAGAEDKDEALARLARRLRLRRPPRILEAFDISNLGGEEAVGSAVRFVEGAPDRRAYRSYGIRTVQDSDDYGMMFELLHRHLRRRQQEGDLPDLVLVDGGKGQLGVAQAVLEELQLKDPEAIALAKGRPEGAKTEDWENDRVFVPGRKDAVTLRRHPEGMRILQAIRDEAHRFALTRHRKRRGRKQTASVLDRIEGVGPRRKRALLKTLGSLRRIQAATVEELAGVPGISARMAKVIYEAFHGSALPEGPER